MHVINNHFEITCVNPQLLCCDGFIDFNFISAEAMEETLKMAMQLRSMFLDSLEMKLTNDIYTNCRELRKKIIKFSRLCHPFRWARK